MVAPISDGRVSRSMVRVPGSGMDDDAGPVCLNLGIVSNLAAMVPVPQTLQINGRNGRHQIKFVGSCSAPVKPSNAVLQGVLADDGKPDSLLPNGIDVGYSPTANIPRPESSGIQGSQAASGAVPSMSSPRHFTQASNAVIMHSSALKRPLREGATEANSNMISKRPRVTSKPSVAGMNGATLNNHVNGVLLNGTKVNNLKGIPLPVLPAVPVAIPLVTGQHQSSSSSGTSNAILFQAIPVNTSPITETAKGINQNGPYIVVPCDAIPLSLLGGQQDIIKVVQDRHRLMKENMALKYRLACFQQLLRNKEKLMTVLNKMNTASVRA